MVEVKHVTKQYGQKKVVEDISLTIQKGKITSFIGPNGAGKSTLLAMVSRLVRKDSGDIIIDGKEISESKSNELAKKMAILKQSNAINIRITIKDLVSFGRFPYSQGRLTETDEAKVKEALHYMRLENIQEKYIDQLSGGQLQRAYIAMVLAQDTEYVLLDEPLNNLDMNHSVEIMKALRRMVDDLKKTVVIVLHDINFASCYSDYIVALKEGKIVKEGQTEDIITSTVLKEVYDMDIQIETINYRKICIYYT
ncbi:iron complex transport system ATP-binding protein [Pullulanibacillus pueri]|uniref:Putative ABC transporter ATP-binding protein YclP n=1 Tax=Pullulanibacillus pueri TaxID=1437324 RepID=A0A8J2ZTQ2_9BACL|nr:ABC transporter ATP-binding protein [Pullulanibacillus pueri]MBM7680295.1 iron complex transport system ATP-binding protein [Pullulanibacillus pueri]GGH75791.1 putative ABC transporter ATP-binding protein YclP [Pullulanibacillus pueri]